MARVIVVGGGNNPVQPNMGYLLANTLLHLRHEPLVLNSSVLYRPRSDGWDQIRRLQSPAVSEDAIADVLDLYVKSIDGVQALALAIPANPVVERAYIDYCIRHGIYISTITKGALADDWDGLRPHLPMIGYYGAVGGRALVLPWAQLQQLPGKKFLIYGYLNATVECFFQGTAGGRSPHEMYRVVKALMLAEPGSDDYVSCINIEIGGDYVRKIPIFVNSALVDEDGPFMTPAAFDPYVPLKPEHILEITTQGKRFAFCISSTGHMPLEVEKGTPGTLSAEFGGLSILGGFCDPDRNVYLRNWMQGGANNGVKIVFQKGLNESGKTEITGEGAGPDTIWSAIINLNQFLARPKRLPKNLEEVDDRSQL